MENTYKFISDKEPSDAQLKSLMTDVLKEVKKRSIIANKKFQLLQKEQIKQAKERFNAKNSAK